LDLVQASRPVTQALAAELGETVNVVILAGRETLYLDQASGTSALQIHNWIGARNPLHAKANGRVLLAGLEAVERETVLAGIRGPDGGLPRLTERTVSTLSALRKVLAEVEVNGYAIARDELEIGLTAVAAPVRGGEGGVIASLSASGPTFRLVDRLDAVAVAVLAAAAEVSRRMGFHGGARPPSPGVNTR
jgi:DNA-binding IclR family transcriptional regulator